MPDGWKYTLPDVKYDKLLQPMEMKLGKLRGYHVR